MSSLGVKPVRGGRPASERRISGVSAIRAGVFVHEIVRELILVVLKVLSIRNAEEVIRI